MSITELKEQSRKIVLFQRLAINPRDKKSYDQKICSELQAYVNQNPVQSLHTYLPIQTEINILPFIQWALDQKKSVFCPKTKKNGQMSHHQLTTLNELEEGLFGTQHPTGEEYNGQYDLIIVPVVGLTPELYRLGYGGGYYDRFLEQHPSAKTLAAVYPFQCNLQFPVEDHDAKIDILLSDAL